MARNKDQQILRQKYNLPDEPAQCWEIMEPEFVEYVKGKSLTIAFPVLTKFTNPRKTMQGGFICAAFDNTIGALLHLETRRFEIASIDLQVNYQRPVFEGDRFIITAYVKSIGKTIAHLYAEAYDEEKRLIATATTNIMMIGKENYDKKD